MQDQFSTDPKVFTFDGMVLETWATEEDSGTTWTLDVSGMDTHRPHHLSSVTLVSTVDEDNPPPGYEDVDIYPFLSHPMFATFNGKHIRLSIEVVD